MKCPRFPREFRQDKPWRNQTLSKLTSFCVSRAKPRAGTDSQRPGGNSQTACVIPKARRDVQSCSCGPGPRKTQVPEAARNLESPSVDAGPSRPRVTGESNVKVLSAPPSWPNAPTPAPSVGSAQAPRPGSASLPGKPAPHCGRDRDCCLLLGFWRQTSLELSAGGKHTETQDR